jgi:hypothetical protein
MSNKGFANRTKTRMTLPSSHEQHAAFELLPLEPMTAARIAQISSMHLIGVVDPLVLLAAQ